jgi:hypothetical protein
MQPAGELSCQNAAVMRSASHKGVSGWKVYGKQLKFDPPPSWRNGQSTLLIIPKDVKKNPQEKTQMIMQLMTIRC